MLIRDRGETMKLLRLVILSILALLFATNAYSFRSTKSESFTDPDYLEYQIKKIVVIVEADSNEIREEVESRIVKAMEKFEVVAIPIRNVFPPTRDWTMEEQLKVFAARQTR